MRISAFFKPLSFILIFLIASCGKIELPENDSDDKKTTTPDDGDTTENDICSVSEFFKIEDGSLVTLKGYIVGFVKNNTIKQTIFGVENASNSNIVLADNRNETDYTCCTPIKLAQNSEEREELNLLDNPDMLGTLIAVTGTKTTYFNTAGIKSVETYEILDKSDDSDDKEDHTQELSTPTLNNEAEVFEGF